MKKLSIILLSIASLIFLKPVSAQELAYEKGDISLNAGMSFGLIGYGYGYYGSRSFPVPLNVNVDVGISEYFSVGGFFGYLGMGYGDADNRVNFRALSFGVDGTFHASTLLNEEFDFNINDKKVDYYARLMVGFETSSLTYSGTTANYLRSASGSRAIFAPVLGVRYMFSPNFGGYIEGGRGTYGYLTIGLSLKF